MIRFVATFLIAAWLGTVGARADEQAQKAADPKCLEDLQKAMKEIWPRVRQSTAEVQVTAQETLVTGEMVEGKPVVRERVENSLVIARSAEKGLRSMQFQKFNQLPSWNLRNEKYWCHVQQLSPDSYKLVYKKDLASPQDDAWAVAEVDWYLQPGLWIWGVSLEEAMTSPEFEWRESYYRSADGRDFVRVGYIYRGRPAVNRFPGAGYWADLEPQKDWLVQWGGVDNPATKESHHFEVAYQKSPNGPVPGYLKLTTTNPDTKSYVERYIRYPHPQPLQMSAQEFYLPHYGITENPWTRRQIGASAGALALVVLGLGVWMWKSRAQPIMPPIPRRPGAVPPRNAGNSDIPPPSTKAVAEKPKPKQQLPSKTTAAPNPPARPAKPQQPKEIHDESAESLDDFDVV